MCDTWPMDWTVSATVTVLSQGILDRHSDDELVFCGLIETATTQRTLWKLGTLMNGAQVVSFARFVLPFEMSWEHISMNNKIIKSWSMNKWIKKPGGNAEQVFNRRGIYTDRIEPQRQFQENVLQTENEFVR